MERYIGLDAHAASCTLAVVSQTGRRLKDFAVETNGQALVEAVRMIPGRKHLVFEEGLQSACSSESEDPDDAVPHKRVTLRCTPAVREKWHLVREIAERVAGQRLRAGEVLEFVAAEVFSAISIDPVFAERPDEPPAGF